MAKLDYTGLAVLVGAVATGISVLGNFVMATMTFVTGRSRDKKLAALASKVDDTHDLVDGVSEELKAAALGKATAETKLAFSVGKEAGRVAEQGKAGNTT